MRALLVSLAVPALVLAGAGAVFADSRMERTLKLDPGGTFRLDTDMGSVVVHGKSGSGAHVLFESAGDDLESRLRFQFDEGTGSASVTAKNRHQDSWFGSRRDRVHVTVEVPFDTAVDVRTSGGSITLSGTKRPARIRSSGGSLTVDDLAAGLDGDTSGGSVHVRDIVGDAHVRTSGGSIEAERIRGSLDADTSGGSVRVETVSGDVKAHSSGGPIHIREASGRVDAETSGGGAEVAFARGNGKGGRIESSGGGITVLIDPTVGLDIDAHADRIDSDLPITTTRGFSRESLRGTLNGGGASLRIETSGGSVHIRPL
jgi:DUF4097 and DUF4098 domain-containing protein YvlB